MNIVRMVAVAVCAELRLPKPGSTKRTLGTAIRAGWVAGTGWRCWRTAQFHPPQASESTEAVCQSRCCANTASCWPAAEGRLPATLSAVQWAEAAHSCHTLLDPLVFASSAPWCWRQVHHGVGVKCSGGVLSWTQANLLETETEAERETKTGICWQHNGKDRYLNRYRTHCRQPAACAPSTLYLIIISFRKRVETETEKDQPVPERSDVDMCTNLHQLRVGRMQLPFQFCLGHVGVHLHTSK